MKERNREELGKLRSIFQKYLMILLSIKFFVEFISAFFPLSEPHLWRQTDTMSVAMRYWLRWSTETNLHNALLPAVLNSGDHYGINPMEFPVLNLMTAPFFYFGPLWGKIFAHLFLIFVLCGILYLNSKLWKKVTFFGVSAFEMCLLLPVFSFANPIAWHFMPDFMSLLLCLAGLGFVWNKNRILLPFLFVSLGLLMKPTSIIVFALIFCHHNLTQKIRNLIWFLPSLAVTVLYYTLGVSHVRKFQDIPDLFAVGLKPISQNWHEFTSNLASFLDVVQYHAFVPYLFYILVAYSFYLFYKEKKFPFLALWLISFLQIFAIILIDGKHSVIHYYYFIGVAPTFCLIALGLWHKCTSRVFQFLFFALFLGRFIDLAHFELRSIKHASNNGSPIYECHQLIQKHPEFPWKQGLVFRSTAEDFPALGLCFGERERSEVSKFGFMHTNKAVPENCHVVDKLKIVALIQCK